MHSRSLLLAISISLLSTLAHADNVTTIFPPKTLAGADCTPGQTMILAWKNGAPTTYCIDGQEVLKQALPACTEGQQVIFSGGNFICKTLPLPRAWANVTHARALNATYTNTTGADIEVSVSIVDEGPAGTDPIGVQYRCNTQIIVNGVMAAVSWANTHGLYTNGQISGGDVCNAVATVPGGATYQVKDGNYPDMIVYNWAELRP